VNEPTPERIIGILVGYQPSEALRTAFRLDVFTAVGQGARRPADLARRIDASERGVRMLCDYLVVLELLTKDDRGYELTDESRRFCDRRSPDYVGTAAEFLCSGELRDAFGRLDEAVRRGSTAVSAEGTMARDHEVWTRFARGMVPLMRPPAEALAELILEDGRAVRKVLDVAAGHGLFGIAVAKRRPDADVYAVDWGAVLEVAAGHAREAGVGPRFHEIAGSAFEVDLGASYDLVLVPNLLHHFSQQTCVALLRRIHTALADTGRLVILEHVPDENRVCPPRAAAFALVMLATTPEGDAYTFSEYRSMLHQAGFTDVTRHAVPESVHTALVCSK